MKGNGMTAQGEAPPVALKETRPSTQRAREPGQGAWIARRLGLGVLTMFVVSVVVFAATLVLPGDAARMVLGQGATPQALAAVRKQFGLDQPPVMRYLRWIEGIIFHGNLGHSLVAQQPVAELVLPNLGNTLLLLAISAVIGLPIAVALGTIAAIRPGGVVDRLVGVMTIVISALPEFVVALILIALLATGPVSLFPAVSVPSGAEGMWRYPQLLVLPVATLVIIIQPYVSRQVRASLLDTLNSEFVVMAELKGLSRRTVLLRHAMPNGLPPTIQAAALTLLYLMGGTVVVETIFAYPGLGYLLVSSVGNRDIPVVQAIVLMISAGYVLINITADLLTVLVTPKLRTR